MRKLTKEIEDLQKQSEECQEAKEWAIQDVNGLQQMSETIRLMVAEKAEKQKQEAIAKCEEIKKLLDQKETEKKAKVQEQRDVLHAQANKIQDLQRRLKEIEPKEDLVRKRLEDENKEELKEMDYVMEKAQECLQAHHEKRD